MVFKQTCFFAVPTAIVLVCFLVGSRVGCKNPLNTIAIGSFDAKTLAGLSNIHRTRLGGGLALDTAAVEHGAVMQRISEYLRGQINLERFNAVSLKSEMHPARAINWEDN
jgi:hypothetical protein